MNREKLKLRNLRQRHVAVRTKSPSRDKLEPPLAVSYGIPCRKRRKMRAEGDAPPNGNIFGRLIDPGH